MEGWEDLLAEDDDQKSQCENLNALRQELTEKIAALELQIETHETGLNDESYLLEKSDLFMRTSFRLWLHDTYQNFLESESNNPQLDLTTLRRDLKKFLPLGHILSTDFDDDYYERRLNLLHTKINTLVKKAVAERDKIAQLEYLAAMKSFSRTSEATFTRLQEIDLETNSKQKLFHQKLYRHLLSLAIHERVLSCFAFGMDPISSKLL